MESRRPLYIGIAAGAAALLVAAGGLVVAAVTGVIPLWASHDSAKLMPAAVDLYASVSVDLRDVAGFRHLRDVYGDLPQVQDALDRLSWVHEPGGYIWEEDILPWLGSEIAVAVTGLPRRLELEPSPAILLLATRDRKASDAFIQERMVELEEWHYGTQEVTYEKVTYWIAEFPSRVLFTPIVLTRLGDFVVITSDPDAMEAVIDVEQGRTDSLEKNERYREMIAALPKGAQGRLFVDLRTVMDLALETLDDEMAGASIQLPSETIDMLEAYQAFGLAVTLDSQGIQFDLAMTYDPDLLSADYLATLATQASPNRILEEIPAEALVAAAGQDLGKGWQTAWRTLTGQPDAERQIRDLGDELGVGLDDAFLSWLVGEFAIVVVEAPGVGGLPVGGYLLSGVGDRGRAQDTLDAIASAIELLTGERMEEAAAGAYAMRWVEDPGTSEALFGLGLSEDRFLLALSGDAMDLATGGDFVPLSDDLTFKAVQGRLPGRTATQGYANVERLLGVATADMPDWDRDEYDESVAPIVEPVKAIGFAAEVQDPASGLARVVLFVYIP